MILRFNLQQANNSLENESFSFKLIILPVPYLVGEQITTYF